MNSIDEHLIRDKLCENLNKIEEGLVLYKKECYLKAPTYGTRGFIDILAKDRHGYAVVIELKTRRSSTREAIHELIKYSEYLQIQFGMNPSEIRLMLITTDWTELLIPFSSFCAQTHINLEGYQIFLNDTQDIEKIKAIRPIEASAGRLFSDSMMLFECNEEVTADRLLSLIKEYYKEIEYGTYIILKLKAPENFEVYDKIALTQLAQSLAQSRGETLGKSTFLDEYHSPQYCLCIATKSHSQNELLTMLKNNHEAQESIYIEGYESATDVPLFYLHSTVFYHNICNICIIESSLAYFNTCTPQDLSVYINQNGWEIEELIRGPVYEQNGFLTDTNIKFELLGNETTDRRKMTLKFETDNRSSIYHVQQALKQSMDGNPYWRIPLLQVLERIESQQIKTLNGYVTYFDPKSILRYLYLYSVDNIPDSLLPRAILSYWIFDTKEKRIEQIRYICIYEKTRKSLPFNRIVKKFYENSIRGLRIGVLSDGYREDNLEIAYDMGFECSVYKETILNYFPVHIDKDTYQILPFCNEPPIYEKYDFIRNAYVECSIDSDVFQLSYARFIQEEKKFIEKLSVALKDSKNSLFYI